MLVTFKTDVYANTLMFGNDAQSMLKMMGHSGTVPGAILAEDVPAVLSRLMAALEAQKDVQSVHDEDDETPAVSMAHRGLPLVELLTAAARAKCNVMWD